MEKAKNAEEYIAQQRQMIASNPDCGTSYYNLAVALIGIQKYDEAEKELFNALECSPGLAEAMVQLGGLALRKGDLDGLSGIQQKRRQGEAGFLRGARQHRFRASSAGRGG